MTISPCPIVTVTAPLTCVQRYAGADGIVQKSEAVQAVVDYFDGLITKQCAIDVVLAYFEGGGTDPVGPINPASDGSTPVGTPVCWIARNLYGTIIQNWPGASTYRVRFSSTDERLISAEYLKIGVC